MTIDNAPWLDGATILLYQSQRYKGAFIWGIKYSSNKGMQGEVKVELVYEVRDTNGIYLIEPIHGQTELIGQGVEMYGKDEYRLNFFKSNDDYKRFFETLNKWLKEGKVEESDYAILLEKFKSLNTGLPILSIAQAISILYGVPNPRTKGLMEAKEILSNFPLMQRICSDAQVSLL